MAANPDRYSQLDVRLSLESITVRRGLWTLVLVAAVGAATAHPALAVDPSAGPSAAPASRALTCAERYPAEGPGGVDLQIGCMVNELVGFYSGAGASATAEPARISAYLVPLAGVVVLAVVSVLLVRRALGRRLVSVSPTAFWQCPACRSVNPAGAEACYRCRRPWEPGATEFRTDGEAPAPQSFGRRHDGR